MTIMNDLKFDRTVSAALQDIGSMTFPKGIYSGTPYLSNIRSL